jgi:VIT1/CCC1 family predicted Fe2+/Mn2+ transporter
MFCANCGSNIKEGLDFCPNCGKSPHMVEKIKNKSPKISSIIAFIIGGIWYIIFFVMLFNNNIIVIDITLLLIAVNGSIFTVGGMVLLKLERNKNYFA